MSRHYISLVFLNSLTTFAISYLYNVTFHSYFSKKSKDTNNEKFEYLYKKIHNLEQSVIRMQEMIEEIDIKIDDKNNHIIESNIALNSKLEEYINYNYDIYE
jgi:peptidoglycan hydrolase CwlO-like protein